MVTTTPPSNTCFCFNTPSPYVPQGFWWHPDMKLREARATLLLRHGARPAPQVVHDLRPGWYTTWLVSGARPTAWAEDGLWRRAEPIRFAITMYVYEGTCLTTPPPTPPPTTPRPTCLLYHSAAADEEDSVELGARLIM